MIKLHILPEAFGLTSVSPYCLKAVTLFELMGVEYERAPGDLRKSPNGKVPYLDDGGELLADSHLILRHLERLTGRSLDEELTPAQHMVGHAAMRLAEEGLYWTLVYARWVTDLGWRHLEPIVKGMVPGVAKLFVPGIIRKSVLKQLHAQGVSRYSAGDVFALGARDLESLNHLLGAGPFFGGARVSSYDAAVYGPVKSLQASPYIDPLVDALSAQDGLVAWLARMDAARAGV